MPSLVMKSLLGIILCEANLVFSVMSFFFLKQKFEEIEYSANSKDNLSDIVASWAILASGLTGGFCGMCSSLGSAVVNSSSSIAIAGNPKMFSKLITLQLIVGGVGILGTVISLVFLKIPM